MKRISLAVLLTVFATPALAHTGHGDTSGFVHGLQHPLLGLDHLAAMLAAGLWSGFVLHRRAWMGSAAFLPAMAAGAALSWGGIGIPMAESWIVMSLVVFGLLTAVSRFGQAEGFTRASLAAIALFALCHGHVHAAEASGDAAAYLLGFLATTAALLTAGIGITRAMAGRLPVQRALGLGIAASGLSLMVG